MNHQSYYVICIKNEGYEADLKLRTVYRVLPDESAERSHYMRVVDETGEDYLFPADFFVPIAIPLEVEKVLFAA